MGIGTVSTDTQSAVEVQAKEETTFFQKLQQQVTRSSTAVGVKINNFKSVSLQIAEKLTAGRNTLGLNVGIKDITKPKQVLQSISLKSINWRATVSMATSWAKIYADKQNGTASIDLKNVIGAVNTKNMASTSIQTAAIKTTTSRMDLLAKAAYNDPKMWWAVRLSNYTSLKTPFSKARANSTINIASQAAISNALTSRKK
jgi:hypothetical protein